MKKIVLSFLALLILCSCGNQPFDQEAWLKEPEKRQGMMSSLTKKYELKGMTEKEVVNLLGEPAQKLDEPSRQYVYYLGRAGLGVDDSLLRLSFNENGEVEDHQVSHD